MIHRILSWPRNVIHLQPKNFENIIAGAIVELAL
jgi:hypothetical protein